MDRHLAEPVDEKGDRLLVLFPVEEVHQFSEKLPLVIARFGQEESRNDIANSQQLLRAELIFGQLVIPEVERIFAERRFFLYQISQVGSCTPSAISIIQHYWEDRRQSAQIGLTAAQVHIKIDHIVQHAQGHQWVNGGLKFQ